MDAQISLQEAEMKKGKLIGSVMSLPVMALCLLALGSSPASAQPTSTQYGSVTISPVGGAAGPSGSATFEQSSAGGSVITVRVQRLPPNTTHANHIHAGSCDGPILYPLT